MHLEVRPEIFVSGERWLQNEPHVMALWFSMHILFLIKTHPHRPFPIWEKKRFKLTKKICVRGLILLSFMSSWFLCDVMFWFRRNPSDESMNTFINNQIRLINSIFAYRICSVRTVLTRLRSAQWKLILAAIKLSINGFHFTYLVFDFDKFGGIFQRTKSFKEPQIFYILFLLLSSYTIILNINSEKINWKYHFVERCLQSFFWLIVGQAPKICSESMFARFCCLFRSSARTKLLIRCALYAYSPETSSTSPLCKFINWIICRGFHSIMFISVITVFGYCYVALSDWAR